MTHSEMDLLTNNSISRLCYHSEAGDLYIVGKYSKCVPNEDGTWDVWLCNPKNPAQGLGERRINNIDARIREMGLAAGPLKRLTGEGVYPSMPQDTFLSALALLGIRRRRIVTQSQLETLRKYRKAQAGVTA